MAVLPRSRRCRPSALLSRPPSPRTPPRRPRTMCEGEAGVAREAPRPHGDRRRTRTSPQPLLVFWSSGSRAEAGA
eukprot:3287718-Alexandrium_andersonii.AAC.1